MLRRTALGLALVWAGLGFLHQMSAALEGYALRDRRTASPLAWRFGMPQVERLAASMAAVRAAVPAGSRVGFASSGTTGARFLRSRWAAYLAPDLEVFEHDPAAAAPASWLVVFGAAVPPVSISNQRGAELREEQTLPGGRLYRVLPRAAP